jgi:biopolymer transport protein TolQ
MQICWDNRGKIWYKSIDKIIFTEEVTMDTLITTELANTAPVSDFSIWSMFVNADFIVQIVMVLLLFASIWSWTVIFQKLMTLARIYGLANDFENIFWSGKSLEVIYDKVGIRARDPLARVFSSAMRELQNIRASKTVGSVADTRHRLGRVMSLSAAKEMDELEKSLGFLATIGSTAPFVGLFGTVWGIMHSFQGIAMQQSTNLAVVAPGIAEALFATALGLIAAIPAVIAYNRFSSDVARFGVRLDNFVDDFSSLLDRVLSSKGREE